MLKLVVWVVMSSLSVCESIRVPAAAAAQAFIVAATCAAFIA